MLAPGQHGRDEMCAVSAHGVRVRYADGRELLCGTSGLWNANLGYGNQAIAKAAYEALLSASYLSVWGYENSYARQAAYALVQLAGSNYSRVLFSTSGGAANDMAIKIVRHYHVLRQNKDRKVVLAMSDGFHGMTYGAFALTDANLGQRMYGVDRRLVAHLRPNEPTHLKAVLDRLKGSVAAIVVEPVMGTGAVPLTNEYVAELLRCRAEYGFLLVADEVSTGFGRIGPSVFATKAWPEPPDILITAKGLTNGTMAASAAIVSKDIADTFTHANAVLGHAETQAGTPAVAAAIMATISEIKRLGALKNTIHLSGQLDAELSHMVEEEPLVSATTGAGCLRSLRLCAGDGVLLEQSEVPAVVAAIREAGALVHPGPNCIQLLPALIYTDEDLSELLTRVRVGLRAYAQRVFGISKNAVLLT